MAKLEGTQIIIIVIVVAFFILAYFKDIEVGYNIKLAGSMNRVFSSTNIPINNKITVTYNAPNTECTLEETLPNGWIADVTLYNHKFREDFGSNTIKTHQYSHVDNIASSYTFVGGQWWCPNGVWTSFPSVTVTTVACSPTTEICDNIDNDCDGSIDESLSQSQSCGTDIGYCQAGTQTRTCSNGAWGNYGSCAGSISAITEICNNGIDEDCNGVDLVGNTLADTSCNGCIENPEFTTYKSRWLSFDIAVGNTEYSQAKQAWLNFQGC